MTPTQNTRECDCGKPYNLAERLNEIGRKYPNRTIDTMDKYCCDDCWESYTQSQDFIDHSFSKDELESLLSY